MKIALDMEEEGRPIIFSLIKMDDEALKEWEEEEQCVVEITKEEYADYCRVRSEFTKWQKKLGTLYDNK